MKKLSTILLCLFYAVSGFASTIATSEKLINIPGKTLMYSAETVDATFMENNRTITINGKTLNLADNPEFIVTGTETTNLWNQIWGEDISLDNKIKLGTLVFDAGDHIYDVFIPLMVSEFSNDVGYITRADIGGATNTAVEQDITILTQDDPLLINFTNSNQQMFILTNSPSENLYTVSMPNSEMYKHGLITLYLQELPLDNYKYDISLANFENTYPDKPWLYYSNNALWKFELESTPESTMWTFNTVEKLFDYPPPPPGYTLFYKIDGSIVTNDIRGAVPNKSYPPMDTSITNIEFGTNVTSIGNLAYARAFNLKSITMREGIKSIGDRSFMNCEALEAIEFPDSLVSIDKQAFQNCYKVKTIHFGKNFNSFGLMSFYNTTPCAITEITVSPENQKYKAEDGMLLSKDGKILYIGVIKEHIVIPDGVEIIYENSFSSYNGIISVEFPNTLKTISDYAFAPNTTLTTLVLPDGLKSIGINAFSGIQITSINIPDSVETIGASAISFNSQLITATIGNGVTVLNSNIFEGCSNLETVTLGNNITTIDKLAFKQCPRLMSVTIAKSKADVQAISPDNFPWGLSSGCVITCADGETITVP